MIIEVMLAEINENFGFEDGVVGTGFSSRNPLCLARILHLQGSRRPRSPASPARRRRRGGRSYNHKQMVP